MDVVLMLAFFSRLLSLDSDGLKAWLSLKKNLIFIRLDQLSSRNIRYDNIEDWVPIVLKFTSIYNTIAFYAIKQTQVSISCQQV